MHMISLSLSTTFILLLLKGFLMAYVRVSGLVQSVTENKGIIQESGNIYDRRNLVIMTGYGEVLVSGKTELFNKETLREGAFVDLACDLRIKRGAPALEFFTEYDEHKLQNFVNMLLSGASA